MTFLKEISDDIDWRFGQLATIKSIPLMYPFSEDHKETYMRYAVASVYSVWEGFVRYCFTKYIITLNGLNIPTEDVCIELLTHTMTSDDKLTLENVRTHFDKKMEFVEYYNAKLKAPLSIGVKLPTKSNVNFEVINDILRRFNLLLLDKGKYEGGLNKLLRFRNDAAHGSCSIPVKMEDLSKFTRLVEDLMIEVYCAVEDGYNSRSYLTSP